MPNLIKLVEPQLVFGHGQSLDDPRDGLTLFGPLKEKSPFGIKYGLIGTGAGISRFYKWKSKIIKSLAHEQFSKRSLWIPFPGFKEIFGIPFDEKATSEHVIDSNLLRKILKEDDQYQRVYKIVNLYVYGILRFYKIADEDINIWYVISPESVYRDCRPKSTISDPIKHVSGKIINKRKKIAKMTISNSGKQTFIFPDQEKDYYAYNFDSDFRRQLKARLIIERIRSPIQIFRESTLVPQDFLDKWGKQERILEPDSQLAWNSLTTTFYKAGGKPWKLSNIREGVCYLGMVFKKLENHENKRYACCAAQMFLDSGDGVVFRGAIGPWKSKYRNEFHLDEASASEIIHRAIETYKDTFGKNHYPKEVFIHGRTYLNDKEWFGFSSVSKYDIKIVGIRIRPGGLRIYRPGRYPALRGMVNIESKHKGYLWSTGFIPKLRTYPYQGIPYPLEIEICRGEHDILTVMDDILKLTKLNYNACHFADGMPITLKFADKIGDILTAGPIEKDIAPLSFKFYI